MSYWDRVLAARQTWVPFLAQLAQAHFSDVHDPFQACPVDLPHSLFGSPRPFSQYLSCPSSVDAGSLAKIRAFLVKKCIYRSDAGQFNVADHWQMPDDFERSRQGDCEDSALWAWRKLVEEVGVEARFVVGSFSCPGTGRRHGHAWVMFKENGKWRILETIEKVPQKMVLQLEAARGVYYPLFAVDGKLRTFFYPNLSHLGDRVK